MSGKVSRHAFVRLALLAALAGCAVQEPATPRAATDAAGGYQAFQGLLQEWVGAVADNDVDRALSLLTPNARVRLDYLAYGPEIRPAIEAWFPGVRNMLLGPADYDASANLAYGVVRVLVVPEEGGSRSAGIMTVVARWTGGRWMIRSLYMGAEPLD